LKSRYEFVALRAKTSKNRRLGDFFTLQTPWNQRFTAAHKSWFLGKFTAGEQYRKNPQVQQAAITPELPVLKSIYAPEFEQMYRI
jgi:hypothetical protein